MEAFAKLAALFGVAAGAPLTDEHLKSAEAKIAQLETDKSAADLRATNAEAALATMSTRAATAEASLKTANADLVTAAASLTEAKGQVATLEQWKKEHASATDERLEDESNERDEPKKEALTGWEATAASAIASAKKRHERKAE